MGCSGAVDTFLFPYKAFQFPYWAFDILQDEGPFAHTARLASPLSPDFDPSLVPIDPGQAFFFSRGEIM